MASTPVAPKPPPVRIRGASTNCVVEEDLEVVGLDEVSIVSRKSMQFGKLPVVARQRKSKHADDQSAKAEVVADRCVAEGPAAQSPRVMLSYQDWRKIGKKARESPKRGDPSVYDVVETTLSTESSVESLSNVETGGRMQTRDGLNNVGKSLKKNAACPAPHTETAQTSGTVSSAGVESVSRSAAQSSAGKRSEKNAERPVLGTVTTQSSSSTAFPSSLCAKSPPKRSEKNAKRSASGTLLSSIAIQSSSLPRSMLDIADDEQLPEKRNIVAIAAKKLAESTTAERPCLSKKESAESCEKSSEDGEVLRCAAQKNGRRAVKKVARAKTGKKTAASGARQKYSGKADGSGAQSKSARVDAAAKDPRMLRELRSRERTDQKPVASTRRSESTNTSRPKSSDRSGRSRKSAFKNAEMDAKPAEIVGKSSTSDAGRKRLRSAAMSLPESRANKSGEELIVKRSRVATRRGTKIPLETSDENDVEPDTPKKSTSTVGRATESVVTGREKPKKGKCRANLSFDLHYLWAV